MDHSVAQGLAPRVQQLQKRRGARYARSAAPPRLTRAAAVGSQRWRWVRLIDRRVLVNTICILQLQLQLSLHFFAKRIVEHTLGSTVVVVVEETGGASVGGVCPPLVESVRAKSGPDPFVC